ncbi:MAG: YitT family protein [Mycobacterium leprae]
MRSFGQAVSVIVGALLVAASYQWFYVPYHLVTGGVAGIALLTHQLLHWPIGLQVLVYNIPILWWGWRDHGRRFILLTVLGILSLTTFTTFLPQRMVIANDPMLNAIFGGLVNGIGAGLAFRASGSLGGLDVAVVSLNRRYSLPIGDLTMGFNALIVAALAITQDVKLALYTLVSMFVIGRLIDVITTGAVKKTALIVTSNPELVAERINHEMGRGVTRLEGVGAYSGESRSVLICVITRYELARVKEITAAADPQGFIAVLQTDQVSGRFAAYNFLKGATNLVESKTAPPC